MADHGGPADRAANKKRDLSVSMARANVVGPLLVLAPMSVLYLAYGALWGFGVRFEIGGLAGLPGLAALYAVGALALVVGVVAHELLHGFSFVLVGKQPPANVKLLGFQRETLTPYSHCKVPIEAGAYRWAVAMPGAGARGRALAAGDRHRRRAGHALRAVLPLRRRRGRLDPLVVEGRGGRRAGGGPPGEGGLLRDRGSGPDPRGAAFSFWDGTGGGGRYRGLLSGLLRPCVAHIASRFAHGEAPCTIYSTS